MGGRGGYGRGGGAEATGRVRSIGSLFLRPIPHLDLSTLSSPPPSPPTHTEIYRTLPVREDVLKAVLGADLIGFHTYDYARHFISSCTRILGLEVWGWGFDSGYRGLHGSYGGYMGGGNKGGTCG